MRKISVNLTFKPCKYRRWKVTEKCSIHWIDGDMWCDSQGDPDFLVRNWSGAAQQDLKGMETWYKKLRYKSKYLSSTVFPQIGKPKWINISEHFSYDPVLDRYTLIKQP